MDFGNAIRLLKEGHRVARQGWNGKGMWLALQMPDQHSKMTLPYVYLNYPEDAQNTPGARVPWLASQTDMLAEDWVDLEVIDAPAPAPAAPPTVEEVIAMAVDKLLKLAAQGQMGRMPERPVDVLLSVCTRQLQDHGISVPADLRQRCNDALMSALLKG